MFYWTSRYRGAGQRAPGGGGMKGEGGGKGGGPPPPPKRGERARGGRAGVHGVPDVREGDGVPPLRRTPEADAPIGPSDCRSNDPAVISLECLAYPSSFEKTVRPSVEKPTAFQNATASEFRGRTSRTTRSTRIALASPTILFTSERPTPFRRCPGSTKKSFTVRIRPSSADG